MTGADGCAKRSHVERGKSAECGMKFMSERVSELVRAGGTDDGQENAQTKREMCRHLRGSEIFGRFSTNISGLRPFGMSGAIGIGGARSFAERENTNSFSAVPGVLSASAFYSGRAVTTNGILSNYFKNNGKSERGALALVLEKKPSLKMSRYPKTCRKPAPNAIHSN